MFIIFFLGRKLEEALIQCAENAFTKPLGKNMLLRYNKKRAGMFWAYLNHSKMLCYHIKSIGKII